MTMLTPDEAKQQICPFFGKTCRGPDCLIGWRWAERLGEVVGIAFDETVVVAPETWGPGGKDTPRTHRLLHTEARSFDDKPALRGSYARDFDLHPRRGYCGAFGSPRA